MKLHESLTPRILFHYTNAKNLNSILKSGKLKGQWYKTKATNKKNKLEIATVRPSAVTKDFKKLSHSIGNVRVVIDAEKVSQRAKIAPVSEHTKEAIESVGSVFKKYNYEMSNIEANKKATKFLFYLNKNNINNKELIIKNLEKEIPSIKTGDIDGIIIEKFYYDKHSKGNLGRREGEERIIANSVPLNSKYIKIELLPDFIKNLKNLDKEELLKNIIKNKYLFIKNKTFNDITKGK